MRLSITNFKLFQMPSFQESSDIIVTCHKFNAPSLAKEIKQLGFQIEEEFITGVKLKGSLNDCIKLNLNLHCASQVLYKIDSFNAYHPDDIYLRAKKIDWATILPENTTFSITSNVFNESVNNNMFVNLRLKDAIVDQFRSRYGIRPNSSNDLEKTVIHLHWKHSDASLFLDTSGASLGRHGYRKIPGKAPMLEALASSTILATNWNFESPFVNPMCGSGTLAIEAILLATNRKPGLFRTNYGFMHLKGYDDEVYYEEDAKLEDQIIDKPNLKVVVSDYSRFAIDNTEKNAIAAGVRDYLEFQTCDFAETILPETEPGIVMINPEYGERLGNDDELVHTYKRIGDFFKQKCQGYTGYVFTGNMQLGKHIGLKPKRKQEFYNSKIECRLLEFELYGGSKREFKKENE